MSAQDLADLRWLLLSAPLLDATPGAFPAAVQQFTPAEAASIDTWLTGLQAQPALWHGFMHPASPLPGPPMRLGRRAERLLEFFLRHGPTHRFVVANLPLHDTAPDGKHTSRGEIDFLLEDRAGRRWHWELAVKFYLCTAPAPTATLNDLVGPNRSDTLAAQVYKLIGQQLRHRPPVPWNDDEWAPAALARGWLFYPRDRARPQVPGLHPEHASGTWLTVDRLASLPLGDWCWLPRERWLSPARESATQPLQALDPPGVGFQRPALAVRLERGIEVERVFIVPDGW